AHRPRDRRPAAARAWPAEQADRRTPGDLAEDRPPPHRAHLCEDRRLQPRGRQPVRHAARPALHRGSRRHLTIAKMGQLPHPARPPASLPSDQEIEGRRIEAAMSLRGSLLAMTYDRQMAKTEQAQLRALRQSLLAAAAGDVLEIGGGTGANLPFYRPGAGSLTITEPETPMVRRLGRRARDQAPLAKVLRAPAEDLPVEDGTFHVAVSTLVLCRV